MSDVEHRPFRARLDRRADLWWNTPTPGVHDPAQCHELRLAEDSDEQWKCCRYWQRKLSNKWNGREFAKRHGVRVPHLFWSGRDVAAIPFDTLPDSYVIRLTTGYARKQVVVMRRGVNLLEGVAYDREQIRQRFATHLADAFSRTLMLVEERIPPDNRADDVDLPTDYRFHMFGDVIGFITVTCGKKRRGYREADWTPIPKGAFDKRDTAHAWPRPVHFERMREAACTLGRAYESYVRVDMYHADDGPVFGEFSPLPNRGRHITAEADALLERLWAEHFPDAL